MLRHLRARLVLLGLTVLLLPVSSPAQACPSSALSFDGVDDYVRVADDPALDGFNDFTIEFWVRGAFQTGYQSLAYKLTAWSGTLLDDAWSVAVFNGVPTVELVTGGAITTQSGNTTVTDNTWHHFALARTGSAVSMYIDGTLDVAFSHLGQLNDSPPPLTIGSATGPNGPGQHFNGEIDEVRVWNLYRTQTEIQNSMGVNLVGNEVGLVGYWQFNSGTGQWAVDTSIPMYDGTLGTTSGAEPSDPQWVASGAPTACATPQYQTNFSFAASLDVNGVQGTPFTPATVTIPVGTSATLGLASVNVGQPWDLGAGSAPLVPAGAGALVTSDGQIVNLDVLDPTVQLWFNFLQGPPWGPSTSLSIPFSLPAATAVSAQMVVVDPALMSGIALSQPVRLIVQ